MNLSEIMYTKILKTNTMKKKILYIRPNADIPLNITFLKVLESMFPEFTVDTLDIGDALSGRDFILFKNRLCVWTEYAKDIALRHKNVEECFIRTSYLFKKIKQIVAQHASGNNYVFTFQIQSLFDASVPGIPHFVYTDHTHLANLSYPGFDRRKLYSSSWIRLEKTVYQNAETVFTMSNHISDSLMSQYSCNPKKVVCAYGSGNTEMNFPDLDNQRYYRKNILFVGTDWERKGGPELIKAFKIVLQNIPDASLTIVGCSPNIKVSSCRIVGRIPLNEVNQYYERATVFCMPSHVEPFGITFIEALSHKLPVIATNIGAIPDFIKDGFNGFLVDPHDTESLARQLSVLISDPQKCIAFGERGAILAKEMYTWDSVGTIIKEVVYPVVCFEMQKLQ